MEYSEYKNLYLRMQPESRGGEVNTLLRILEVQGLTIGSETGYSEDFRGLPQSVQANIGIVTYN
jgi:hypothetical protein